MTTEQPELTEQEHGERKISLSDPSVRARVDKLLAEVKSGKKPSGGVSPDDLLNLAREQREVDARSRG
jgi:hypothetical protein